jgi:signal transduction histidine kinase/ligand-binding sensor domain-containing protein/CheY-like chemotaxis protein
VILVFAGFLKAQNSAFPLERIATQKWLNQRNITCLTQDAIGYVWFGTNNGLYRFDGYEVAEYKHDPFDLNTITHNNVNCIYADKENVLWVGTWGGLTKFETSTGKITRFTHDPRKLTSLSSNDVRAIAEDGSGNLWIGTFGGGLNKLKKATGECKSFQYSSNNANSISSNYINALIRDKGGDIWLGTRRGINKLEPENSRFTQFQEIKKSDEAQLVANVSCILEDAAGKIWFGTFGGGLMQLDRRTGKINSFLANENSISNNTINALVEEEPGMLWIATGEGLNMMKADGSVTVVQNNPNAANSLLNNDVKHLLRDMSGVMWIVSAEGVNVYSKLSGRFKKYQRNLNEKSSLSNNNVTSFVEDTDGMVWIGTREGLNKFDRKNRLFTKINLEADDKKMVMSNDIKSLLIDKKGRFWIGGANALSQLNPKTGKVKVYRFDEFNPNSLNNEIFTIYESRNGDLWVGLRKGLAKFYVDSGKFQLYKPDPTVSETQIGNSVYTILEDRFGKFWVGTLGGGLSEFDRTSERFIKYQFNPNDSTSLSNNSVISLYEDRFGFFWVGTYGGGLNRMDRKKGSFINYAAKNGLQDDMIYGLLEDEKGNLWISTNLGLVKFDTKTKTFRNYDVLDGVQGNVFNIGASYRCKNGEMFFGGAAGFNLFYPDSISENNYVPPTVITSFKVLDKPTFLTNMVKLAYNQNYITFEFSSLSYALLDKNHFAYKLDGFDEDWIYCGSRKFASYSNLGPGEYVFHVKSSNSDGLWNEKGVEVSIVIERPYWKTWWFISLGVIIIIAFLYFGYWYRVRNFNKVNLLLEAKVKRRTAELEKATEEAETARIVAEKASQSKSGFLANMSHEIRTPLNGILGFTDLLIKSNPKIEDKKYLELIRSSGDTLLKLLSDILDLNKIEQGKLTIENIRFNFIDAVTQTLIPYQYRANEKGLQFMLNFDPRIPEYVNGDITRIKQLIINLVSNSLKFTERGGIAISFEAESDPRVSDDYFYLRGIVSDTGIGVPEDKQKLIFDSFTQADGSFTRKYGGSGLGLSIVKQLLKLMHGEIRLISPALEKPFKSDNQGASFVFRFRLKAEKVSDEEKETKIVPAPKAMKFTEPYTVLLVEDNKINQLLASTVLENFGLKVITADDGLQGVEKVKAEDVDLILMDVQMPVMNGYESTAAIRTMGMNLPIIGLTANVYKEDIDKCIESGMNAHLGKPFNEMDLFNELKKWLS